MSLGLAFFFGISENLNDRTLQHIWDSVLFIRQEPEYATVNIVGFGVATQNYLFSLSLSTSQLVEFYKRRYFYVFVKPNNTFDFSLKNDDFEEEDEV